ncbi:nitroreductase [Novosphingobium sp.]|uniref:nitroreductase n=1 Tax=Novosphingobium sp. TaxID=1874826 RepID=UPI001ED030CE|nr:nitroreductase [Novosphingobium sp.]MBK9010024.1 nitroreductase [Novosphingobium sp.]
MNQSTTVTDAVLSRRSIRAFADKPVPLEILRKVMDTARWAPSGCNFQPWEGAILTGAPLRALQEKMKVTPPQDPKEYSWSDPEVLPECLARLHQVGADMYSAMNIERGDKAARGDFMAQNIASFNAPAVLMVYFPRVMGAPQWSDVGMWLQTIMLLLREAGLDTCPQEFLSMYAKVIKDHLGVSDESHIFFCGIAIGYRDEEDPVNGFDRKREPLDSKVKFLGFE